jgi:hypothetical protein
MTDAPPKPKRRRWRWLVVAVCALTTAGIGLVLLKTNVLQTPLQRAERLEVGQKILEVEQIMGASGHVMKVGPLREIRLFGLEQTIQLYAADAKHAIGVKPETIPAIEDWPVVVHFDPRNGRVFRIKKGDVWTGTTSAP